MPDPTRLRATALSAELREALRERPHGPPTSAQLDELRSRLGFQPLNRVVRRERSRRLRRTAGMWVLFPIAATAAVGGISELHQRRAPSAPTFVQRSVPGTSAQRASRTSPDHVTAHDTLEPITGPASPPAPAAARVQTPSLSNVTTNAASPGPLIDRAPSTTPTAGASAPKAGFAPLLDSGAPAFSELNLLQRANASLKTRPSEALALAEQHRSSFPNGNLAQEREVIAIKALLSLGEQARARLRLANFERLFPGSVHVLELRQIVH